VGVAVGETVCAFRCRRASRGTYRRLPAPEAASRTFPTLDLQPARSPGKIRTVERFLERPRRQRARTLTSRVPGRTRPIAPHPTGPFVFRSRDCLWRPGAHGDALARPLRVVHPHRLEIPLKLTPEPQRPTTRDGSKLTSPLRVL
jgi:hypothetical protein